MTQPELVLATETLEKAIPTLLSLRNNPFLEDKVDWSHVDKLAISFYRKRLRKLGEAL